MTTTSASLVCDCCSRLLSRQLSRAQRYVFEINIDDVPADVAKRYRELMDIIVGLETRGRDCSRELYCVRERRECSGEVASPSVHLLHCMCKMV